MRDEAPFVRGPANLSSAPFAGCRAVVAGAGRVLDGFSDALGRGAVQVPGSGQPIVMMSDCGTTGGYAKIATVIGADLWKLAQARPQDSVRFSRCTDQEAVAALLEEKERYRLVAQRLVDPAVAAASKKSDAHRMNLCINHKKYQIEIEEVK